MRTGGALCHRPIFRSQGSGAAPSLHVSHVTYFSTADGRGLDLEAAGCDRV